MIEAGKLDKLITIERNTEIVRPSGAVLRQWTAVASVRAQIVEQSTDEFLAGYGEAEKGSVVFRVRYLAGITTADQIAYNGERYDLQKVVEIGRRRGLELRAVVTK